MIRQSQELDSESLALLGEPSLVCRTSRKTLFWSFALAVVPCGLGALLLLVVANILWGEGNRDILGCLIYLAVGGSLLWCGWVLCKKANRLRHVVVTVHARGLSYRDGCTSWICRWDDIEDVQTKVMDHFEESNLAIGGVVPIPGTTRRTFIHTSQQVTVRRKDGDQMIFTNELQNIEELARAIFLGASQASRWGHSMRDGNKDPGSFTSDAAD